MPGGATAGSGDVVVNAELTALSGDAISSGSGAATPIGTVAVAANLADDGDLSLSFVDGNDHLQLIETNVAELLQSLSAADGGARRVSRPRRAPPTPVADAAALSRGRGPPPPAVRPRRPANATGAPVAPRSVLRLLVGRPTLSRSGGAARHRSLRAARRGARAVRAAAR